MPITQEDLDVALDLPRIFAVQISPDAPLPLNRPQYDAIRQLPDIGFDFTLRELLHAVGSKFAALPANYHDDCIRAALFLSYTLDLEADELCFHQHPDSDLVTPQSQAVGIGMLCLLAYRFFDIPWDQLGSLPGPGLRFDYRGRGPGIDAIFESKGTRHRGNQSGQISSGVEKKAAHHQRGQRFDIELIVSTFIGEHGTTPRILIGDPDFDKLASIYDRADDRFFRLRHYARVLQFVGLPKSAFLLNAYAKKYLRGERRISKTILDEKALAGYLTSLQIGEFRYFGRWFDTVVPEQSKSAKKDRYRRFLRQGRRGIGQRRVFQGMREDVYRAGFYGEPFSHKLLSRKEIERSRVKIDRNISLFPDGTIQIFEQIE